MKYARLVVAAAVLAVLIPTTGCWRNHCCHDSYKHCAGPAPTPAPAYYVPSTGCP